MEEGGTGAGHYRQKRANEKAVRHTGHVRRECPQYVRGKALGRKVQSKLGV